MICGFALLVSICFLAALGFGCFVAFLWVCSLFACVCGFRFIVCFDSFVLVASNWWFDLCVSCFDFVIYWGGLVGFGWVDWVWRFGVGFDLT